MNKRDKKIAEKLESVPGPPDILYVNKAPLVRDDQQQCVLCGEWLPSSGHYFDADRSSTTGFRAECKQCRAETRNAKKDTEIAEYVQRLDKAGMSYLADAASLPGPIPMEVKAIVEELLYAFSGPRGFAQHVYGTYASAAPGSTTRQKLLGQMLTIFERVGRTSAEDMEIRTTEELREELLRRMSPPALKVLADASSA